jgi:hypothetical protein
MAAGKICATVETILVALRTEDGRTGWGEVRPIPGYLPAYAGGGAPAIAEFAPMLLGADPHGPEAVLASRNQRLQRRVYAKSAIDIALFDLFSQIARPQAPICEESFKTSKTVVPPWRRALDASLDRSKRRCRADATGDRGQSGRARVCLRDAVRRWPTGVFLLRKRQRTST